MNLTEGLNKCQYLLQTFLKTKFLRKKLSCLEAKEERFLIELVEQKAHKTTYVRAVYTCVNSRINVCLRLN